MARCSKRPRRAASSNELLDTAYHEAAHAVVARHFGIDIGAVTVTEDADALGRTSLTSPTTVPTSPARASVTSLPLQSRAAIEHQLIAVWAGLLTEECGCNYAATSDGECIYDLAELVCLSPEECNAYVEWLRRRTANLLDDPIMWSQVEAVTAALFEHGTLTGREIDDAIRDAEPPT